MKTLAQHARIGSVHGPGVAILLDLGEMYQPHDATRTGTLKRRRPEAGMITANRREMKIDGRGMITAGSGMITVENANANRLTATQKKTTETILEGGETMARETREWQLGVRNKLAKRLLRRMATHQAIGGGQWLRNVMDVPNATIVTVGPGLEGTMARRERTGAIARRRRNLHGWILTFPTRPGFRGGKVATANSTVFRPGRKV
jgi:hypothetical protein